MEGMFMKSKRLVIFVFLFLLVGAVASTAYCESPIVISPSNWYTGILQDGNSKSATFTVKNESSGDVIIRNLRLKTTSSSFSIAPATALPVTLPPAGEMQVEITFAAPGEGFHQASIEVDYTEVSPEGL
jgi:hypothetical protein